MDDSSGGSAAAGAQKVSGQCSLIVLPGNEIHPEQTN